MLTSDGWDLPTEEYSLKAEEHSLNTDQHRIEATQHERRQDNEGVEAELVKNQMREWSAESGTRRTTVGEGK